MAERNPVYALADVTVPTRDERKEVIASEVIEALGRHLASLAPAQRSFGGGGVMSIETVAVRLGDRTYDILIGAGLVARAGEEISAAAARHQDGHRHRRQRSGRAP